MTHHEINQLKQEAVRLSNKALKSGDVQDQTDATRAHIVALEATIDYDTKRLNDLKKSLDTLIDIEIKKPVKRVKKPAIPVLNTKPARVIKKSGSRRK